MNQPSYEKRQNSSASRQQNASAYSQQSAYTQGQPDRHLIRFINYDGSVIQSRTYVIGETVAPPVMPPTIQAADGLYQFSGWSPSFSPIAQGSVDYYASYTRGNTGWKKRTTILLAALAAVVVLLLVIILAIGKPDTSSDHGSGKTSSSAKQDDSDRYDDDDNDSGSSNRDDSNSNDAADEPAPTAAPTAPPTEPPCQHAWADATVYAPKTCSRCGEISGSILPSPPSVERERERISAIYDSTTELIDTDDYECETGSNGLYYYYDDYGYLVCIRERASGSLNYFYDSWGDLIFTREEPQEEVYYYYDADDELLLVVTAKGNPGIGTFSDTYRRYYYFEDGQIVFAIYEGSSDTQRFYFYAGRLMRWTYRKGGVGNEEDYTYSDDFIMWEQIVMEELASLGVS